ncbi:MAG: hypothetical protein COX70_09535 [Flavobacteriales bacterium CG_4_10_14_0_2_um_filter_32_8]|nr:MAG: hypothetical protein COX70_09535 [Flavobacteriales bacterium CG_4_10_14_0_2_um_filter_32_8]PJB14792.1 MAG: hypothetical protein CO118_06720 [Flavobacteriales bacterium CG_4_9_14_3_um_filter_32_8]
MANVTSLNKVCPLNSTPIASTDIISVFFKKCEIIKKQVTISDSRAISYLLIQNLATHIKISDAIKKLISTVVEITAIEKGAILVKEGNSCNELFYLNSGLFRSFYTREKGDEVSITFFKKMNFLPM